MPDPKTDELRIEQIQRERSADRAAYLKSKLEERAKSEDEV
jgi:hypothetical protein